MISPSDPMTSAKDLKRMLSTPDVRVVDATWIPGFANRSETGSDLYQAGHIPGAVFFDIDEIADSQSDLPHMLPDPVKFSSRVRKLGLGDGNRIVIYDQNGFFASARVWWMFRAMGHKEVTVLDGGFTAWLEACGEIEDLPPVAVERHFTARARADLVKSADQVAAAISSAEIIDARPEGRFNGTAPEPREGLISGHMPGGKNIPATSIIDADGKILSVEALTALFEERRVDFSAPNTITTCGSGVSAAVINLALARLGNWEASLYDGSWTEWGASGREVTAT